MSKGKVVLGTMFGAVAGFVAGVLTAPKSGKQTRADVKDAAKKAKDTVVEDITKARAMGEEKAQELKTKAEGVVEDVTEKAHDLKARTEQAVDAAKKGFHKTPPKK